jgi:aspartate ammonia-lyase
MQDAVPITLGQEFSAYAVMVGEDIRRITGAKALIQEINLGGTAIGTGINSHPDYPRIAVEYLQRISGVRLKISPNLIEATQDTGAYVQLSGVLKRVAVKISKICNDLRLLSSGPRAGLNEINLPPVQAGSSIMPGKVNPVIPEVFNEVAFQVIGSDLTVTLAAEAGQLELNPMGPIIAYSLFHSVNILRRACVILADKCIQGITANRERCRQMALNSISLVTALNPMIGYAKATEVAREAHETDRSVQEIILRKGLLSKEQLEQILTPKNLTHPKYLSGK